MAGKQNTNRLTPQDRGIILKSNLSVKNLAAQYGVCQSTIYKTINKAKELKRKN